ncbi:hypothetical protein [Nakamurella sp.]|uniref:hypothetical protein n=1 Tax=Nakamurella sp. TaxID=1869182 RepID=UPI003782FBF8
MTRPNLEGLFTGSAPADPPMTWLNGKPAAPELPPQAQAAPRPTTPAPSAEPAGPAGLFDPIALAERYFAMMQTLLDLQRDFGMRVAHQVAELPPINRFRR